MRKLLLLSVAATVLSACAIGYDHPTANYQQYLKERYLCLLQACTTPNWR